MEDYKFTAEKFIESDGSVTLSLNEIDLVENAPTEDEAKIAMGKAMLEYANDYYQEFELWSKAPNRKHHIPYVQKALNYNDEEKIAADISVEEHN
jgi:hypothetical protein